PAGTRPGEKPKPPLARVYPGGAGRGEVQVEPWMPPEPRRDRRGLVGAVVVAGHMDVQRRRHGLVDRGQKLLELGGAMLTMQLADDAPIGDVERREQTGDPVPLVVVGAAFG